MAQSLNLTGEEKLETIFIPVVSVLVSKKAGSCYGHSKMDLGEWEPHSV